MTPARLAMQRGELVAAAIAAARIGVCRRTIVRWIKSGALTGRAIKGRRTRPRWYVHRASLDALLSVTEEKP